MIPEVMEDFEAYGQLRDRPRQAQQAVPALPQVLAPPRPKRSHWLRNLVLLAFAYVVLAVGTTVQPLPVPFTSVHASVPFPGGAPMLFGLPDRPFTVLVIGLDRRPTETGASRTDTVLLVRIDPRSHKAAFLSIPRDSLMEVPLGDGSYTQDRINTAYVFDWSSKDSSAAPKALMATIQHNLGIHVDHYVTFDQRSAEDLIQSMGGVTIDNPREFGQADYSDDDVHVVPQQFAKGKIHLNGYEAVAYGRIREGSTDFDRIQRQQRVGSALIHEASSPLSIVQPAVRIQRLPQDRQDRHEPAPVGRRALAAEARERRRPQDEVAGRRRRVVRLLHGLDPAPGPREGAADHRRRVQRPGGRRQRRAAPRRGRRHTMRQIR